MILSTPKMQPDEQSRGLLIGIQANIINSAKRE